MQIFKDKTGQDWTLDLPVGTVLRVRAHQEGRFDLFEAVKGDLADRLHQDLVLFWDLLWLLVEPEAVQRNVTAGEFGQRMAAECLVEAQCCFFAEWRDFFRRLHRPDAQTVVEKTAAYHAKAMDLVQAKIRDDPTLQALDERLTRKIEAELNNSFGTLQASLDKILGPTPSGSSGG